jgi:hypothetical protein
MNSVRRGILFYGTEEVIEPDAALTIKKEVSDMRIDVIDESFIDFIVEEELFNFLREIDD